MVVPVVKPEANPVAVTLATLRLDEYHVTALVRFCMLPSLYTPVAVNCKVPDTHTDGLVGETVIPVKTAVVAGVTVRRVEPLTEPAVATIVA